MPPLSWEERNLLVSDGHGNHQRDAGNDCQDANDRQNKAFPFVKGHLAKAKSEQQHAQERSAKIGNTVAKLIGERGDLWVDADDISNGEKFETL